MDTLVRGMTISEGWGGVGAYKALGVKPADFTGTGAGQPSMGAMAAHTPPSIDANGDKPWHPDSPLFWFGIILATTFGLIGAATSIRVGPFKAAVGAGNP